jgi:ComF family protein
MTRLGHWRGWLAALGRAILPAQCALCAGPAAGIVCAACHAQFVAPIRPRCALCANPVAPDVPHCGRCLAHPPPVDATVAAVDYAPPLDQLVLRLKFGAALAHAGWFAEALTDAVLASPGLELPELLCPVPLADPRLRARGFNQALEIARPLARALGVPLERELLLRVRATAAQSTVRPSERADNLRGAFTVAAPHVALVRGRHIGVVDDVMTSGHTLAELAATLKRFGAARVTNLVFARTPPSH